MPSFRDISVSQVIVDGKKKLNVHNPTKHPMIGIGAQGAVFRLSPDKCVKVYEAASTAEWEAKALAAAKEVGCFPKLYEKGEKYVVMEYVEGPTLQDYLDDKSKFTDEMAAQILDIVKQMRKMKFARIDTRLGHIIVTKGGQLKVIDHSGAFRVVRRAPGMLLKSLEKAGVLKPFLRYTAKNDPRLYEKWQQKLKGDIGVDDVPKLPKIEKLLQ
ncbi:MAG: kinase [Paenibacillus sp.]|jgi:predicted Ser/Thr protein kinase|nr:kinase [Paenibacillus sp.]